jgi:hypothetical protein
VVVLLMMICSLAVLSFEFSGCSQCLCASVVIKSFSV